MRIMGLDYGSVTVGVALSDSLNVMAHSFKTIKRKSENTLRRTLAELETIAKEQEVEKIILGLPINMDNTLGERALRTLDFKEKLEKRIGLPVILWDERLSTWAANEVLDKTGFKKDKAKRKEIIDQLAAEIILQGYIDYIAGGGKDEDIKDYGKDNI